MRSFPSNSGSQQQSLFQNPHGIREASTPYAAQPSSRARPTSMVIPSSSGISSYQGTKNIQTHMPGAFPGDVAAPYRRPTDVTAALLMSNASVDQISTNSDTWDSEGDSASNLSVSTNATTVASSEITSGKNESGTATPRQGRYEETERHSRPPTRAPLAPILRRHSTQRSVPSTSTKTTSSSAAHSSTRTSPSGTGSSSTKRSGYSGGPNIHIEVHKATSSSASSPSSPQKENSNDPHTRRIEEILLDKIEQLKTEQNSSKETKPASVPSKPNLTVRFAEPKQQSTKLDQLLATMSSEKENALGKEVVLQGREINKLEKELEKRELLIREKQKVEEERRLQDERARADRERQRERDRHNLEIERREIQKAQRAEHEERQKERQRFEREKKEAEKAQRAEQEERQKEREKLEREKKEAEKVQKALEKERAKERQQAEKERKEIEEEKARVEKAQKEHEKLQASFVDQGKILGDLKARFDEQARALKTTEAERNDLRQTKAEFEERCSTLMKSLSHVSDKERYVVEQVASLQIIKESLQKRVGPLEERAMRLSGENDQLHAERESLMRDTTTYLTRITELEKELKGSIEEQRGLHTRIGELEKRKSGLKSEVRSLRGQTADLEASIESRAKEYSAHVAALKDDHKVQIENQASRLEGDHKAQVDDLQDQITGLNEHIDGAHADIDKLKGELTTLGSSLADEKAKCDALTAERDRLQTDVDAHALLAVSQETNILHLRDDVARRSDAIAQLQEANRALQAEHDELQRLADDLDGGRQATAAEQHRDLRARNDELAAAKTDLEAKNAGLEARIAEAEERAAAPAPAAPAEEKPPPEEEATATVDPNKMAALEEEAAKVPALLAEKAALEAKAADLEAKTAELEAATVALGARAADLEAQAAEMPALLSENARLAEQLAAANKLIEGLAAAHEAGLNINNNPAVGATPLATPLSPSFPTPPMSVAAESESPKMAPPQQQQQQDKPRKTRSRAPSMVRSVSSRSSASKRSGGVKDDIALVMVRKPGEWGSVQVMRKTDLRAPPRSRSQPPDPEE